MAEERVRINPESILDDILIIGAAATVKKLNNGEQPQWTEVLRMIETGDPRWLAVASGLAAGTDAATSEDLQVMLAKALPINPQGVLSLADSQTFLSIENLCVAPFIEPELDYLHRYLAETLESLRRLKAEAVEAKRKRCIAQIERVLAEESARK